MHIGRSQRPMCVGLLCTTTTIVGRYTGRIAFTLHLGSMIHRNLGIVDRILRFALAVWWLGPWAPSFPSVWVSWAIFVIGWVALVESFIGWCALHTLFGIHECEEECVEEET